MLYECKALLVYVLTGSDSSIRYVILLTASPTLFMARFTAAAHMIDVLVDLGSSVSEENGVNFT